jgi:hypothetical protein
LLDSLQKNLDSTATVRPIRILGVNMIGLESGNPTICAGRTLPWLQDVSAANVWNSWGVTFRDVVILDAQNKRVGVYNLTEHDLRVPANYAELRAMLISAAATPTP